MFDRNFQAETPLLDAINFYVEVSHAGFFTPGHKQGKGVSQKLRDLLGSQVFKADLTELANLDNLSGPEGVIKEAQTLAAAAFGAEESWFLVNGSTGGIIAAILATCGDGEKIILPRNVHKSVISGLILSGAIPIFVQPEYDANLDVAHSITPEAVANALKKHPDAKAVLMVYPTYYGVCGDVEGIANLTHQYNIPLLVDEAHGPHFAFHPDLPPAALSKGADLSVQSIHKVLSALTQASILHVQGERIDRDRLSKALQLIQSSSPSYLLLASLDAARQQMALSGKELMTHTLQLAEIARNQISEIPQLSVLELYPSAGFVNLDRTRLTVILSDLNLTGFAAEDFLTQLGVIPEFSSRKHLTFIITFGNTSADIEKLVQSFQKLTQEHQGEKLLAKLPEPMYNSRVYLDNQTPKISPRKAFFAATETVPINCAVARICAETICPYPPGIPVLMPGEIITPDALEYLLNMQAIGSEITGCADATLRNLKVVKSE
ncbi:aminotransferase class I/II-fold pyridoxal phosphate-dependent enzyme [Aerosakkonemataceae cyanobacterium BLCC-F154]|uniref:Aminotransferase class I/II-fold pyridoxal phosphate-dependent enzyme n=1 Tax=Floridaenema fluviatile BLCC-F154 TaxID=3153640 RepID=A0ABV4Y6J6_9CYAN